MASCKERDDVPMLQRGGELDLAAEALGVQAGRHLRGQDFHHDLPLELALLSQKDPAHPTPAELLLDPVGVAEGGLQASQNVAHGAYDRSGTMPERPPRLAPPTRRPHSD